MSIITPEYICKGQSIIFVSIIFIYICKYYIYKYLIGKNILNKYRNSKKKLNSYATCAERIEKLIGIYYYCKGSLCYAVLYSV